MLQADIAKGATDKGNRVLAMVHRKKLMKQMYKTYKSHGVDMSLCEIVTSQGFSRRLHKSIKPQIIISDESHNISPDEQSQQHKIIKWAGCFDGTCGLIGFTATPVRLSSGGLGHAFETIVNGPSVKWLIDEKMLAPYKLIGRDLDVDLGPVKKVAGDYGQTVTALCGELAEMNPGGRGLEDSANNPPLIEYLKRVFDLAAEFNCNVVTTHIGIIPEDKNSASYKNLQDACGELSAYAAKMNAWLAIETGPEPITRLCEFADSIGDGRIAVNYDPANLVMVTNDDEVKGVYTAGKRIVHTHAKDGIMRKYAGPEYIYGTFAQGGAEAIAALGDLFIETPLGEGNVRWPEYLGALRDIGFNGFLTIEREVGEDAASDIKLAVGFLKEQLKAL